MVLTMFRIDIYSDVVCPWCYVGKRHLETALSRYRDAYPGERQPELAWRPFQLNPHLPESGMERRQYVETKFGGPDGAREVYDRIASAGRGAGIEFEFSRIRKQPNTVDAHRLIRFAESKGRQDAVVETLFQAFFLEGADLTRRETLEEVAARAGFNREEVQTYLAGSNDTDWVRQQDGKARALGITGVPFFVLSAQWSVPGAQPPDVILEALRRAREDALKPGQPRG